ncbi:MAG: GNAT family N-acetyltransferase, partial [Halobacteriales archaeon]|nr:GNAT family N-acetyltransferase [Halobacteriales archaeon]
TDALAGFLRARLPGDGDALLVRELKVLGVEAPLGAPGDVQHRGLGKQLLQRAEEIAREQGLARVRVTSGIGVRGYYARLGYARDGPYMTKGLSPAGTR